LTWAREARVHDARHTVAKPPIEQGVRIRVIPEALGRSGVTATERYTHVATLQMGDASERISDALRGQG
jgi:site-specific recombinase XerD